MLNLVKILLFLFLIVKSFNVEAALYTSTATGDLDSGTVTLTTTVTSPPVYLRQIGVNFSAAPEAAETITVVLTSSAGSNYNLTLAKVTTVAATTTAVMMNVSTPIQIDNTHQVKVTVTNASQSVSEVNDDPTAYISAVFDTVQPSGSEGVSIYRDGQLLSSTRYPSILDESVPLVQYSRVNFTGTLIACAESAANGRIDCTISGDGSPHVIKDETSSLTARTNLNFTGAGVTCTDNAGTDSTDCTISGAVGSKYDTVDDEDTPLTQRSTLNFEGAGVVCADDTDQTTCTISGAAGAAYATIDDEGTPLTQQSTLNMIGASVTCVNDGAGSETDCTFTDGTGYNTVQEEGSGLTARGTVNFIGSSITCVDNGGSTRTDCTLTNTGGWTYVVLGSNCDDSDGTPTLCSGLSFTPGTNKTYDIRGQLLCSTANAAIGCRPGIQFPTGMTDGVGQITCSSSLTGATVANLTHGTNGECNSSGAADTNAFPAQVTSTLVTGAGVSGDFGITLKNESGATTVTIRAGSWIAYREIP